MICKIKLLTFNVLIPLYQKNQEENILGQKVALLWWELLILSQSEENTKLDCLHSNVRFIYKSFLMWSIILVLRLDPNGIHPKK